MLSILVIGSGGREHSLAKTFLQSPLVEEVFCAPGNAGMEKEGIQLVEFHENEHDKLIEFAKKNGISWTFVGPEVPLIAGIVDDFEEAGLKIFGPRKNAAIIEGSKEFAKEIMKNYQIPTADYQVFDDFSKASAYVRGKGVPIVIKADGLAAGKGVVVATTQEMAQKALEEMLNENKYGASGARVVIEEYLVGQEFSLMAFVKGADVYPMVIAQDHKRAFDGDQGPNTGGMGAYSPVPQIPQSMVTEGIEKVLKPAAAGMVEEGRPFTGILYAGLIATDEGPKVIEFNARFGDPETQVVLQRLDSDLAQIIDDLLMDRTPEIAWKEKGYSVGVVVAAQGYPGNYEKGSCIPDFKLTDKQEIYYAGVTKEDDRLISSGGRIYLVTGEGRTIEEAQALVYNLLKEHDTVGTFYRRDIGAKGLSSKK